MKEQSKKEMSPLLKGLLKLGLLSAIVAGLIAYSDVKGYFNPEQANDHTKRKWDSFYDLKERDIHVDVMLFGNSHLYTGINPKNLSLTLGANAFIFASPGTNTVDNYYALKEAVKVQKPSLVILETYGFNSSIPHELIEGPLSNQIVSFSARKDFVTKLASTPALFALDNYLYSWSTTIRNHDYLFTNPAQLKANKALMANKNLGQSQQKGLYLGRYVRFTSGIEQDILSQYETSGAPVDGNEFEYSKQNKLYAKKIIELCEEENIELLFLTLPMYDKHVSNYESWNAKLKEVLNQHPSHWINLQTMPHYNGFGAYAFESTYKPSQHMTYNGSLTATYKLANFIRDSMDVTIPDRRQDVSWHQLYYGGEGYFENYSPANNDGNNNLIVTSKTLQNVKLNSLSSLNLNNGASRKLIAKVDKTALPSNTNLDNYKLNLVIQYGNNGQTQNANVELKYERFYKPRGEVIFTSVINNVSVKDVVDGGLSPR
ncbi:MAG: hypothetical protein ACI89M_000396 [Chitinophagales bacterium]|jgi:hypothetical protein